MDNNRNSKGKITQKLKDFEILKNIMNGDKNIEELDDETKMRIIALCIERTREMDKKIQKLHNNKEGDV